jgi:hypothetical protein
VFLVKVRIDLQRSTTISAPIPRVRAAALSRLRRDRRADDRDLGDRLQRPLRRLGAGRFGGDARPVTLEAAGVQVSRYRAGASL